MTNSITIEDIPLDDERVAFVEAKPDNWSGYVDVQEFYDALKDVGVPEKLWPSKPTANKRLERAMKSQKTSRRVLIRPLSKAKGWSLVLEDSNELELEGQEHSKTAHNVVLTCRAKKVNDQDYLEITPWDHPYAMSVKKDFDHFQHLFKCSEDLSHWFSQTIIPWCLGIATRARGGSYYILKGESLDNIMKVTLALNKVSSTYTTPIVINDAIINVTKVSKGGRIILKPEVASTVAVEILMDNFISECEQVTDMVSEKIKEGKLGYRALSTQKELASDQLSKLGEFEQLLGTKLDDLRDKLNGAKEEAGLAALIALEDC
jgi:hypothetical protein